jgi:hypothetical protein
MIKGIKDRRGVEEQDNAELRDSKELERLAKELGVSRFL